jgi:hypothetical protein
MDKQAIIDEEHLRLLSLAHLISGWVTIAFSSLFIFHFIFMLVAALNPEIFPAPPNGKSPATPDKIFVIFAFAFGFFILMGISFGVAQIVSSKFIKSKKNRVFSYVVGVLNLAFVPYGTVLGICSLNVLGRESIKQSYQSSAPN